MHPNFENDLQIPILLINLLTLSFSRKSQTQHRFVRSNKNFHPNESPRPPPPWHVILATYRMSKKCTNSMLLVLWRTGSITSGWYHLGLRSVFWCFFLLRLSRIKSTQAMSIVKFSPTALNFCYDFVLLVHFLGHPVYEYFFKHGAFSRLNVFRKNMYNKI